MSCKPVRSSVHLGPCAEGYSRFVYGGRMVFSRVDAFSSAIMGELTRRK